jgi:hypothetical protein
MTYRFGKQYRVGAIGAQMLDGYFQKLYRLLPATMQEEENGIDRVGFREDGTQVFLEYKTDVKADYSGRAFIEVVAYAHDLGQRPGWAYTTQADIIVYFLPFSNRLFLLRSRRLRSRMALYEAQYERVQVANAGWKTTGLLVPLEVLLIDRIAVLVSFKDSQHDYCKYVARTARECLRSDAGVR